MKCVDDGSKDPVRVTAVSQFTLSEKHTLWVSEWCVCVCVFMYECPSGVFRVLMCKENIDFSNGLSDLQILSVRCFLFFLKSKLYLLNLVFVYLVVVQDKSVGNNQFRRQTRRIIILILHRSAHIVHVISV